MSAENEEEIKYLKIPFPPHLPLTAAGVDFQLCLTHRLSGRGVAAGPAGRDTSGSPAPHPAVAAAAVAAACLGEQCHREDAPELSASAQRSPKMSPHQLPKGCTTTAAAPGIYWWSETWERSLKSTGSVAKPSFPWKPLIQPLAAPVEAWDEKSSVCWCPPSQGPSRSWAGGAPEPPDQELDFIACTRER